VDRLKDAKYYSKLDLRWGYNNILIKDGDQWKAAFSTPLGLYKPLVMYFGLCNSPATFQRMMNELFEPLIRQGVVVVYLDDILIYTKMEEEHVKTVKEVLKILQENDLFVKPEKCEFHKQEMEYLGLIIKPGEIAMDPVKVKGVMEWPVPKKVKQLQVFLGFCNYYRRFIEGFAQIARPLHELTKKDKPWEWIEVHQMAFENLKNQFTKTPMLAMPNPDLPMRIECDASDFAYGAILSQLMEDNLWHPVAYISKSFNPTQRNYDVHDKELYAIAHALEAWRHYLEGCKYQIEIWMDHKNLEYFQKSQKLSRQQARWVQFLTRFDFELSHKPEKTNRADELSRREDHKIGIEDDNKDVILLLEKLFKVRFVGRREFKRSEKMLMRKIRIKEEEVKILGNQEWQEKIKKENRYDEDVVKAIDTIKTSGLESLAKGLKEWNIQDGIILYRGKVYMPKNQALRREIVKEHHDSRLGGHSGRYKTMELVQQNYWWPGMTTFIKNYVDGCTICQESKIRNHPGKEPLHPTEIPKYVFHMINIDFITDLPSC
jgi:hypothetical protein